MAGMIALNNKDMLGPTVPWVNPNKVRNGCCSKRLLFETVDVRRVRGVSGRGPGAVLTPCYRKVT